MTNPLASNRDSSFQDAAISLPLFLVAVKPLGATSGAEIKFKINSLINFGLPPPSLPSSLPPSFLPLLS